MPSEADTAETNTKGFKETDPGQKSDNALPTNEIKEQTGQPKEVDSELHFGYFQRIER